MIPQVPQYKDRNKRRRAQTLANFPLEQANPCPCCERGADGTTKHSPETAALVKTDKARNKPGEYVPSRVCTNHLKNYLGPLCTSVFLIAIPTSLALK